MKKLPGNENFRRMTLLDVSSKFSQNYLELFFIVSTNRTNKSFRIDFFRKYSLQTSIFQKITLHILFEIWMQLTLQIFF